MEILQLWPETARNVRLRTPLGYFRDRFCGRPMRDEWRAPTVSVRPPKARPKDFLSWLLSAPVVSDRARGVLEPLIGSDVEFLPLVALRGSQFWAVNVTAVADCLDVSASKVAYSPEDQRLMSIFEYRFVKSKVPDRLIFKVAPPDASVVLVRRELGKAIRAERLSGVLFVDPGINQIADIVRRGGPSDVLGVDARRPRSRISVTRRRTKA